MEKTGKKNLSNCSFQEIIDEIIDNHHQLLRNELPRLKALIQRVKNRHGENHPELLSLNQVFQEICEEVDPHMEKEEKILFPLILRLGTDQENDFSVEAPISCMEAEHQHLGDLLQKMRDLTSDYTPPKGACNSFLVLYKGLEALEKDTHEHIHKENNILFPKALSTKNNI